MKTAESKQLSSPKLEFLYKVYMQLSIISWFKSYWDSIILADITAINSLFSLVDYYWDSAVVWTSCIVGHHRLHSDQQLQFALMVALPDSHIVFSLLSNLG